MTSAPPAPLPVVPARAARERARRAYELALAYADAHPRDESARAVLRAARGVLLDLARLSHPPP